MAAAPDNDSCSPLVSGGYDCDFVEPPPDSLQCPVCLLPFRDPNLLSCCGHKGCASCLGRVKAAGHPCPLCQQPFIMLLDKHFQRKVLDLRVYCSKKREGCGWEGELRQLQTHSQRDCDLVEEECQYKCGGFYQRRLLQNHQMEECPQRPPEVITQSLMRKMAERINILEEAQAKLASAERRHQEDKTQLSVLTSKLTVVEACCRNDQAKLLAVEKAHRQDQAKLSAVQKAHREDQAKLASVEKARREDQAKLAAVEKAHRDDQAKLAGVEKGHREDQAKLAAVEKAHREDMAKLAAVGKGQKEDQAKLSHQIQELRKENTSLQNEKWKMTTKMDELEVRLQQQSERIHSVESQEKAKFAKLEAKHNSRNETHDRKYTELLSSLRAVEKTHQEDRTKLVSVQSKLASAEKARREDQTKLSRQIQAVRKENTSLQDEKKKMALKTEEFEFRFQQQSKHFLPLVPAHAIIVSLMRICDVGQKSKKE